MKTKVLTSIFALAVTVQPALADKTSNSLNAAFANDVATLDNYKASGREALVLARLLYDGLVSKDHATGEFTPELAASYEFISDTEMEFKIRPGVKFHDGTTLSAEDVAYTLNLVSSPDYGARYSIAVNWIEKAEVVDSETVRLKMKTAYPLALEMLAGNLPIYPKAYYEEVGSEGMAVKPIGTGPYKLVGITQGVEFKFERFEDYYSGGQKSDAQIKTLTFRVLPEQNTQYAELMNGSLDWIWRVPEDDVARLATRPNIKVEASPIMRFEYMNMNPNIAESPLTDARVRQAVIYAVDRKAIRDGLMGPNFALIDAPCNPIQFGCTTDVMHYEYDPEKAKALLAEAGYGDGFSLSMVAAGGTPSVPEALVANLEQVGIKLDVSRLQYASAVDQWRNGKVDLFYASWGSYGVGDVALSVGNFFGGTGDDTAQDPEIAPAIAKASSIVDRDERLSLYTPALKLIMEKAYWMPMWTYSMNSAMAKDLQLSVNPDEFVPFYDARWE